MAFFQAPTGKTRAMEKKLRNVQTAKLVFLGLILVLLPTILTWRMKADATERPPLSGTLSQDQAKSVVQQRLEPLWWEVLDFRRMAITDYREALARSASEMVRKKFAVLDKHIWQAAEPRLGWSFFMTVSVFTLAATESSSPIVAFYNPWSDLYLVTVWDSGKQPPKMVDAEIFMGDWVRRGGKPPFDTTPLWLRGDLFLPAALGRAVGESAKAFESLFKGWTGSQWRSLLGAADHARTIFEANYPGAAVMLEKTLHIIDKFSSPVDGEPEMLSALRLELALVMKEIIDGNLNLVLDKAVETLPTAKELAKTIPVEDYKRMSVVSAVLNREGSIAFMINPANSDYCLSFYFRGVPDKLTLNRVDVVYYPGWYHEVAGDGKPPR